MAGVPATDAGAVGEGGEGIAGADCGDGDEAEDWFGVAPNIRSANSRSAIRRRVQTVADKTTDGTAGG